MKKPLMLPFLALLFFVLIVSTACGFSVGNNDDATEESKIIVVTATPERQAPTEAPVAATEEVEEAPVTSSEPQAFFVDEFDDNMDNYSWFDMGSGDEEGKMDLIYEDGQLKFELNDYNLWPYVIYEAFTYTDVRIDVEAENWGRNQNSVTMICRYDEDLGWYEFNVANDGTWYIAYFDAMVAKGYITLYNGGSTAIKMGRDTNVYTAICQGQELTLFINGVKTRTIEHKDLKEGYVGVGVASYESYPVNVYFNWLEISQP